MGSCGGSTPIRSQKQIFGTGRGVNSRGCVRFTLV